MFLEIDPTLVFVGTLTFKKKKLRYKFCQNSPMKPFELRVSFEGKFLTKISIRLIDSEPLIWPISSCMRFISLSFKKFDQFTLLNSLDIH